MVSGDNNKNSVGGSREVAAVETAAGVVVEAAVASATATVAKLATVRG